MKTIMKSWYAAAVFSTAIACSMSGCEPTQIARPDSIRPPKLDLNPHVPCSIYCRMMFGWPGAPVSPVEVRGTTVARDIAFSDIKDPIASATEQIISLNATGTSKEFGTVTTTLDTTRAATPTIIRANQEKNDFPATGRINFNVNVTLGNQPGTIYRNREEIQIEDRNLKAFRPHVNANYRLLKPVAFVDVKNPDVIAFTMSELGVAVN